MLNIGEFARTTGLTVKALRYYDEKDVLTPARTDPFTGYRSYGTEQIRPAAALSVLRSMGLSTAAAKRVLEAEESPDELLDRHRREVLAERERQDRIWEEGRAMLEGYASPCALQEREAAPLPWVGIAVPLPDGEGEDGAHPATGDSAAADPGAKAAAGSGREADTQLELLLSALSAREVAVTGPSWSSFRSAADGAGVEMVLAVGLAQPLRPEDVPGGLVDSVVSGVVPARTEQFVRLGPVLELGPELTAPHPGMVALLTAAGADRADHVRQTLVFGADGESCAELVIDVH